MPLCPRGGCVAGPVAANWGLQRTLAPGLPSSQPGPNQGPIGQPQAPPAGADAWAWAIWLNRPLFAAGADMPTCMECTVLPNGKIDCWYVECKDRGPGGARTNIAGMRASVGQDVPNRYYTWVWILERGCEWRLVQQGWDLGDVAQMWAAHYNAPAYQWVYDAYAAYSGKGQVWSQGVVDRYRGANIDCCQEIGGC